MLDSSLCKICPYNSRYRHTLFSGITSNSRLIIWSLLIVSCVCNNMKNGATVTKRVHSNSGVPASTELFSITNTILSYTIHYYTSILIIIIILIPMCIQSVLRNCQIFHWWRNVELYEKDAALQWSAFGLLQPPFHIKKYLNSYLQSFCFKFKQSKSIAK